MFNAGRYIESTISSILVQKKHDLVLEVLIIDDASSDHSCNIVRKMNDARIKLIELEKNAGTANARNIGIKEAKGEWIQFVDSDDKICDDLYKKFETSRKSDINCYLFSIISEYRDRILNQTITTVKDKRAFGHFGSVCNKFIKKDICIEFKKEFSFEDNCFIIDVLNEKELNISIIKDAFYIYNRKNDQSKMANFNQKEFLKMYKYVYSQIPKSDHLTRMFILETFSALIFDSSRPFFMRLQIATRTLLRLFKYLPGVFLNQNRHFVKNTITGT